MSPRSARLLIAGLVPAAVLGIGFGPFFAYRSELPNRLASHFDGSGVPDGSMSPTQFAVVTGALMLLGLVVCIGVPVTRRELPEAVAPVSLFTGAFIAALGAAILATTVLEQRGLNRWEDAELRPLTLVVVTAGALGFGALAGWLGSHLPHSQPSEEGEAVPAMALASGEHAVWATTVLARWLLLLGLAALVLSAVVAVFTVPWLGAILLFSAVAMLSLARIRVRADKAGLLVRYGFMGWPRTRVPIDRIQRASAIDVRPMQWGGWGYRGSLTLMRRAAVVLRAGPGIRLDLTGGKVFVVTVDDPQTPAALLNAEVAGRAATDPGATDGP